MLAFRTNLKSTWPTIQAFGSTTSNTCSSQLELKIKKNKTRNEEVQLKKGRCRELIVFPFVCLFIIPVTLKLPCAGMLRCISMVLLVKVLWVAPLLLLLLHFHPTRGHRGRKAGGQGFETDQLYQGHQALCRHGLVHQEVHSCSQSKNEVKFTYIGI